MSSNTPIFYLNIHSQACTAAIRLNDAPMFTVVREEDQRGMPTISEWVIDGENLLEVHLYEIGDDARIRVALCQAQLGDVPEPGQELELIVIEWPPLPVPVPVVEGELPVEIELPELPLVIAEVGIAAHPWGAWSWEDAPPFAIDPRATVAVVDYVRALHASLARGSVDALIGQSQIKFDEVAPAYDLDASDAELRIRQAWTGLTGHGDWKLADFDEADLELRLHCGGRLVEPVTLAGEPVLRQAVAIDGESWGLPIFVGRTNWDYVVGELAIVR